jgi:alpha-D-xyloside xylohydrolase
MVCPITRPMFFAAGSQPIHDVARTREVYLPAGSDWYDFHSGQRFHGGQTITAAATLDDIPLFVRAGSIIPVGPVLQSTKEKSSEPIELRVYPGADAHFTLYEDAGDGYDYENGEYTLTPMHWHDASKKLSIGIRQGSFAGMSPLQEFTQFLPPSF